MKIVASGACDQLVWYLGGTLDYVISGQCVFKLSNSNLTFLPCFHTLFQLHHDYLLYIAFNFPKVL